MDIRLLNENTKFFCTMGTGELIIAEERGNVATKDRGSKILTTGAKCMVQGKLICGPLTAAQGMQTQCRIRQLVWMNVSPKLQCNGNHVLTMRSCVQCVFGGIIRPVSSECISSTMTDDIKNNEGGNKDAAE